MKHTCESEELNHSDDIWEIWHGRPQPIYLCGFHYQKRQEKK